MNRRRFLKYAGAGAAVIGASAIGLDYISRQPPSATSSATARREMTTAPVSTETQSAWQSLPELRISYAPDEKASLQDLVFLDGQMFQPSVLVTGAVEPVTVAWFIDDYVTPRSTQWKPDPIALAPGEHRPKLVVSDGAGRRKEIYLPRIVKVGDPFIPAGKYGVAEHLRWSVPDYEVPDVVRQIAEAGIQFVRMDFNWDLIESVKGMFDFSRFDNIVSLLHASNIQVLPIPYCSARWSSSSSGPDFNVYPPRSVEEFASFIGRVVEHYDADGDIDAPGRPQIDCYEIWNEENITQFWRPNPDPAKYVELLKASFYAAKYVNPFCCVVLGGLAGNGVDMGWEPAESKHFLQKIYDNGGKGFFDVVAIHPYVYPVPVSSALRTLQTLVNATKAVMKRNHDDKPLWITEIGWSTFPNAWNNPTVSEEEVAVWLTKVYTELKGVDKIFWHNFRDIGFNPDLDRFWGYSGDNVEHHFGLTRSDGSLKPAYYAYKQVTAQSGEAVG